MVDAPLTEVLERLSADPDLAARFRRALEDPRAVQGLLDEIGGEVRWETLLARIHQEHEVMGEADLESVAGGITFVGDVIDFFTTAFANALDIDVHDLIDAIGNHLGPL